MRPRIGLHFFLLILSTSTSSALAQGMFLGDDQDGLGVHGMVGGSDDLEARGAAVVFTSGGTFDIGVAWANTETKEPGEFGNLESNEVTPFLAFAFTRPGPKSAFGAEARLSYSWGRVTSDDDGSLSGTSEVNTSALLLGPAGYAEFALGESFRLMPEAGVYFVWSRAKAEGAEDSISESNLLAEVVLHLVLGKKESGPKVVLSPAWQSFDGDSAWTTTLAIVFTKSDKPKTGWGSQ